MTKNVTRYEVLDRDGSDENVAGHPHVDGEWVRYDDIKHLLHDEPAPHYHQNCATCTCREPVEIRDPYRPKNTADV